MAVLNGNLTNGFHEPTQEELERELPMVYDDQVPLGDALSRVVQAIYAELCELAETCVASFTNETLFIHGILVACPTCRMPLASGHSRIGSSKPRSRS